MKVKVIDPPSGWRYGFPKQLPDYGVDLRAWLIKEGYPREDVDFALEHSRYWWDEVDIPDQYKKELT